MPNFSIRTTAVWLAVAMFGVMSMARADVIIDATDFTVDHFSGNNTVDTNWVGAPFNVNAPVFIGAYSGSSKGNNNVSVSNFFITSSSISYIGAGTSNNSLTLLTNTVWNQNGADLFVGTGGSSNKLTVNGGYLNNAGYLLVGSDHSNNSLVITNGGVMLSSGGAYTELGNAPGTNSTMVVTGTGSLYKATGNVGSAGLYLEGNSMLTIKDGGQMLLNATTALIGFSGSTNALLITGAGSVMSNSLNKGGAQLGYGMVIGYSTSANSVTVSNHAALYNVGGTGGNDGQMALGLGTAAQNNQIIVTDGSVWSNNNSFGSDLYIGLAGASFNSMLVSAGGQMIQLTGGSGAYIGGTSGGGSNNAVMVTGTGSVWKIVGLTQSLGQLTVGSSGQNNLLIISNGASVLNTNISGVPGDARNAALNIGSAAGGSNNSVVVTGAGSQLNNLGSIGVGAAAGTGFDTLKVNDGATLFASKLVVGSGSGSLSNLVLLGGAGASSSGTVGTVIIGSSSSVGNIMTVTNATVNGFDITIGSGSSSNSLNVAKGAIWKMGGNPLAIGSGTALGNVLNVNGGQLTNINTFTMASGGNQLNVSQSGKLFTAGNTTLQDTDQLLVTGSGSAWSASAFLLFNGTGSSLIVSNGGSVTMGQTIVLGNTSTATKNAIVVTGLGSVLQVLGAGQNFPIGDTAGAVSNSITISSGGRVISIAAQIGGADHAGVVDYNNALVTGSGSVWSNTANGFNLYHSYNRLVISNGGVVVSMGAAANSVGGTLTGLNSLSTGDVAIVTGNGSMWTNVGALVVGGSGGPLNNLTVDNNGKVFANGLTVGSSSGANFNSVVLTNGGALYSGTVTVGANSGANNSLLVKAGGVLEANTLVIGAATSGNTISNIGGIYEFTATPTVTPNSGIIAVNGGTISYRSVVNADVSTVINGMTYAGANAFMLNGASNTSATVSQAYTFDTTGNPTNYAKLILINGQTAYGNSHGADINIGAGGQMVVMNTTANVGGLVTNRGLISLVNAAATFQGAVVNSSSMTINQSTVNFNGGFLNNGSWYVTNTTMSISGVFSNNGSLSFNKATATFQNKVYNNGAWITDPTTNIFNSDYVVGSSGTISMSAGDVMIFKGNFVNQSTQSNTYNTVDGKFLFNGVSLTQTFATAGIDYGPGGHNPAPDLGDTNDFFGNYRMPLNNYQLGTMQIANFSTVMVAEAVSLQPGQRGALYLGNLYMGLDSLLIISNNVSVYYSGSNAWNYADNVVLLSGAELHMLVPEPSSLVLWMGGIGVVYMSRRRKRARAVL